MPVEWSVTESLIGEIWCDLLGGMPELTADFFALGGNSMLLVVMLDLVEQKLSASVDPQQLQGGMTIQGLAAAVDTQLSPSLKCNVG